MLKGIHKFIFILIVLNISFWSYLSYIDANPEPEISAGEFLEGPEILDEPRAEGDVLMKEAEASLLKAENEKGIKMLAFGDFLLDRYVRTLIERNGMDTVLKGVQGEDGAFFKGYDFVFANLEGPVTPTRVPTGKSIAFQFSPEHLKILKDNHFNLVSVANNHTFDMGWGGYEDTYTKSVS